MRVREFLSHYFEEIVSSGLFACTLLFVSLNVFTRYVLKTGISWSEEVATGCFVWTVFIGTAACYKRRAHVGVDILVKKLPEKAQLIIRVCCDVVLLVLNSYLFYIGILYVMRSYRKPTPILGISSATISFSLVVSFFDMALWSVIFLVNDVRSAKKVSDTQQLQG